MTPEFTEELRAGFVGVWDFIGRHGPKIFDEIRDLRVRAEGAEADLAIAHRVADTHKAKEAEAVRIGCQNIGRAEAAEARFEEAHPDGMKAELTRLREREKAWIAYWRYSINRTEWPAEEHEVVKDARAALSAEPEGKAAKRA